jgi:Astacin (Peptidase family M12A)
MAVEARRAKPPKKSTSIANVRYCNLPPRPAPVLPPGIDLGRARAIILGRSMWVNGTVLHYYFFDRDTDGSTVRFSDGTTQFVSWVGPEAQQDAVRSAFEEWKELGIGLEFREVEDRSEAEVRIGFQSRYDGSWSYLGRDVLDQPTNARTMNFGWDLTTEYGRTTALHEIGHTLGMPHEHQNPFTGIVWDEQAVYSYFGGEPNNWDRETTYHNVLRKLANSEVEGSSWDPDSIMEYWFPEGLILEPAQYRVGLTPAGTLSQRDTEYVRRWYPEVEDPEPRTLTPFESLPLSLQPGEQVDVTLKPPGTRDYRIGTFGASDVVLVLFEQVDGELRYVAGDDDSGEDRNALIEAKLFQGRRYVARLRMYYATESGQTALMYW